MEILYYYNVNLEENKNLDFENLIKMTLVFIKHSKCLTDFIYNIRTYWCISHEKKAPNYDTFESCTYPTKELTISSF